MTRIDVDFILDTRHTSILGAIDRLVRDCVKIG